MAQLAFFNEGVLSHFVYSMELRYGTSLLGVGILALNDAIDVCFSIHQSALFRGDGDSQLTSRGAKAVISCLSKKNDELRAKRSAHSGRSKERSNEAMGSGRGLLAKTLT